ncbi:MAG TPA: hypothetical protein VHF58_07575 [Solirubrobacterales bacterium]|nr:hypothetical protein [Solirubrobacterales bacterium]
MGAAAVAYVATTGAAAAAPEDRELLERHRPVLRYDASEEYFAQPVSLPPDSAEVRRGDRVYGHVASEAGRLWLQYWFFYAYNPQDRGILRTGRHEGDWELFQVRLARDGAPELATLSQHSWAEGCGWNQLQRRPDGRAPVLYVANGSHALYAEPGDHDRPFPDPTDEADGEGREVRPSLRVIDDNGPTWVAYTGRWGRTEAGTIPGESPSPYGPRFQPGAPWERPTSFHADIARACGSGAPGRWWALPAVVLAAATLCALAFLGGRALRHRAEGRPT